MCSCSYMHYVVLNEYLIMVFLNINQVVYVSILMCLVKTKACGLVIGLLSRSEAMGIHMCITLVD